MSAYDSEDYLGDVASIGGWSSFIDWAKGAGASTGELIDMGWTEELGELEDELVGLTDPPSPEDEQIRQNLLEMVQKAADVLVISDGVG